MNKTFKSVISALLTTITVACISSFDAYSTGVNIEEFTGVSEYSTVNSANEKVIANGTYYISNVQYDKVVQIDDNADSTASAGKILELWGRDGGSDQRWIINQLSNGYYSIKSAASKLAITAPTQTDKALTQETYTGADTQLWKITRTSDNYFKLSPKSNSSYYMAAGSGIFTSNGRNVEMRANQSDNKDEWYLLSTSKRYSQVSLGSSYDLSLNDAVKKNYEKYAHAYGTTYTSIKKDIFINELKSSNYFGAMMHGNGSALQIDGTEVVSLSDISSIPNSSFNSVKVVVLTSCYSFNFVDVLLSKGVDVVIGFAGLVEQELGEYWTEQFVYALSRGKTVEYSLKYANNALSEEYSSAEYKEVLKQITEGNYTGTTALSQTPCA